MEFSPIDGVEDPMLIYTRAVISLGTLVRIFSTDPNQLLLASLLGGFASGDFYPLILSMLADLSKPEERQEIISTMFIFSSFGMLAAPTIGSLFLLSPQINLRNIYQIVLVGQTAVVIYILTQIPETKTSVSENKKSIHYYLTGLLRQANFQGLLAMTFLYYSRSILTTYLQIT